MQPALRPVGPANPWRWVGTPPDLCIGTMVNAPIGQEKVQRGNSPEGERIVPAKDGTISSRRGPFSRSHGSEAYPPRLSDASHGLSESRYRILGLAPAVAQEGEGAERPPDPFGEAVEAGLKSA